MAEPIICQVCGEFNPADMEFCKNCQSRLQPLTGPLRGENAPIQPGQVPTKKVTSELEPALPQWLREARQQARQSADEEASKGKQEEENTPVTPGSDLLAGLASQKHEEEEETPDWLANITGTPSKKKKPNSEDTQMKWVELGHANETGQPPSEDTDRPDLPWTSPQAALPEKENLEDWFKEVFASATENPAGAMPHVTTPAPESEEKETRPLRRSDLGHFSELPAQEPDWLKSLEAATPQPVQAPDKPIPSAGAETPDRLDKLKTEEPKAQPPREPEPTHEMSAPQVDLPDWLKNIGEQTSSKGTASEQDLPDWLKTASADSQPQPNQPAPFIEESSAKTDLPDWISSLTPNRPEPSELPEPPAQVFKPDEPTPEVPDAASAFIADALSTSDVDAIFASMQTPDWLSDISPGKPTPAEKRPPAAQPEEPIAPAELPSWVQAMRPVESAMPSVSRVATDSRLEEQGPLAGLHGVLPVIPGAAVPSGKPKSHSIKLDATDQQQAQAALLEKILAAETAPIPMKSVSQLRSQRTLRWAISVLLLVVLGITVFAGTQSFPLPGAVPNETVRAIQVIEAIPPDAPVLAVFDYQPSTIGEMEATGASLMDHLLLLKHPHLVLLSTSPTGAALAERFMNSTLAERAYQRDVQYVDLGYLPGGLAGVYDFSQNPAAVMPLDADAHAVWQSPVLTGVTTLSNFAAVIVFTDSAESGRVWIEQTASERGSSPMIMVASAQAGPMLLPYADSGQINGLISGINGAAGAEQANGGLPGFVRRYWDAYSLGLYLAIALIFVGGLWNLWLGVQDRRAQAAG